MPIFADSWQDGNFLRTIGVISEQDTREEAAYLRTHYVVLCIAIVATEVFLASKNVHSEHMKQEIGKQSPLLVSRDNGFGKLN